MKGQPETCRSDCQFLLIEKCLYRAYLSGVNMDNKITAHLVAGSCASPATTEYMYLS